MPGVFTVGSYKKCTNPGRGEESVGLNRIRAMRKGERWELDGIHDRL